MIFCKEVEKIMINNGDLMEGYFVKLIRQWYKACDERGIPPKERVNRWINLHKFLVAGINFEDFPPHTTHIKGIPCVTFEGILQNISTHLNLYKLAEKETFNNQAVSTLGIESFFSSLSKADFTMTGCPKATQLHKIFPAMMDYN